LLLSFPISLYAQVTSVDHVILIGVDGLAANYLENAQILVMKKMMAEDVGLLYARSVLPSSSADNWAAMAMGAGPELI